MTDKNIQKQQKKQQKIIEHIWLKQMKKKNIDRSKTFKLNKKLQNNRQNIIKE
jgi:hypothetical protein